MIELRLEGSEEADDRATGHGTLTVGRAWMNDLVLHSSPRVSGRHGQLEERDGALWYQDLGSRNGSAVLRKDGSELACEPGGEAVRVDYGDTLLLGGQEDPSRVRIRRPAADEGPAARMLTTLAANHPLTDVARLAGNDPRGQSFTQFLVGLMGEMASGQVQELLTGFLLDRFPGLDLVQILDGTDEPLFTRQRDGSTAPTGEFTAVDRQLLRRAREESAAILFEGQGTDAGVGFCVPLRGSGETRGLLVGRGHGDNAPTTEEDLQLAQTLAHYAGRVLESAARQEEDDQRIADLEHKNRGLRRQLQELDPQLEIIGEDPGLLDALSRARQVAPYPTPVLITGPSGTGKELVARAIHRFSDRNDNSFLAINCGALPGNLLEAELFGHEKGAFTGADRQRAGLFETANQGTLFLDEVGEIPLTLQVKLLRVLQEGELFRVGSARPIRVDVRVLAATNRDLEQESSKGEFRDDLFYRLNVFPIRLPPLRERPADVPLLAAHFAEAVGARFGKGSLTLSRAAVEQLAAEDWPGNVRELQNRIERAVILCDGSTIEAAHVAPASGPTNAAEGFQPLKEARRRFTRDYVERALKVTGGVQREASRLLGVDPGNLSRLLRDLGLR